MNAQRTVQIIRPSSELSAEDQKIKAAAYCRVSTDSDDQENSFLAQVKYYSDYIGSREDMISKMMNNRDEVVELIRNNLQYALTGNDSVLDVYAIENQIQNYYDQMSILVDRLYSTGGDAEKYELEIKKINDKIAALREQLSTEKAKATSSDDLNREVERILNYIAQTDKDSFVAYDDVTVRRLVECITVSNDGRIVVTLKGGFREEEII